MSLSLGGQHDSAHPFDWAIYPGEQWAIAGPTASGKSLLARAVAGTGPLSGEAAWSGELGTYRSQVPSYVAYVAFDGPPRGEVLFHQARWHAQTGGESATVDASLSPDTLWRRNPYEVREDRQVEDGAPPSEARRERVIADLDLTSLLERRLHHLSDGEWRRVQIAQALLRAPRLLVLDDPFTGLDKDFRIRLRDLLDRLMKAGTQLLLVVPDVADLPEGITHVLALSGDGRGVTGTRSAVLKDRKILFLSHLGGSRDEVEQSRSQRGPGSSVAEAAPVVSMRGVNVTHNGVAVLRDVAWTVRQGERWALVGPNGAGKSTLLSLILGDHPQAYANAIELFGLRRGSGESIWEIKRRIGWVAPELHRYFPVEVVAADVVGSGFFDTLRIIHGLSAEQRGSVQEWLARFELADRATHPFRTLSKGEQRLTLIARALVKAPELLILDEPCQGLDAAYITRVLDALSMLTSPGTTMIYVTHRPEEFPRILTHILELSDGRILHRSAL